MRILVVGATGYLGRHLVAELHARGHQVRAVVRDLQRAQAPGPFESPALRGRVEGWSVGDVTDPAFITGITAGVDAVVSALGVTRQKADPWDIDDRANAAVLEDAQRHGVGVFSFIHAIGAEACPAQLTRAKSAFAARLAQSPVAHQIISPSAYFSDMAQILDMAIRGRVCLLRPQARVNPVHAADVAAVCADQLEAGRPGAWSIGGPQVFTWAEVADLAFAAVGKSPRVTTLPQPVAALAVRAISLWDARAADTLRFALWAMSHDVVGERLGTHHLADFFQRRVQAR